MSKKEAAYGIMYNRMPSEMYAAWQQLCGKRFSRRGPALIRAFIASMINHPEKFEQDKFNLTIQL